jgi:GAF domain-containing protein
METNQQVELCLDLAEATGQISATARAVWSDSAGRVGLGLAALPESTQRRLREWLFLNAMAAAANAASSAAHSSAAPERSLLQPSYTDMLAAVSAVQREAESLGSDIEAVLALVASRSQSLLRASGAAIALAGENVRTINGTTISGTTINGTTIDRIEVMICHSRAGPSAPPVGTALQVGSGFSGECVRTGRLLRCHDTETDERVDRESCRALGIRSMLAAPLRLNEKVIGLLEVFSGQPDSFDENDSSVLQRFADTIIAAINRLPRLPDPSPPAPRSQKPFIASPGSILFAHPPEEKTSGKNESGPQQKDNNEDKAGGIRLSRTRLYLLIGAAAVIALALGFVLAPRLQPWLQEKLKAREPNAEHTVLAAAQPPQPTPQPVATFPATPSVETATLDQLRLLAAKADPTAENALGLLYAQGDEKQGIRPDDRQAASWFAKAAEHGSVSAQYKLGLLYWGGHHGLPKDPNKAYFWTVLARAGGQESSKDLAKVLAGGMTRNQAAVIEREAEIWYQQHESHAKPSPAR